jgi:hypothetical protein
MSAAIASPALTRNAIVRSRARSICTRRALT